MQQWKNNKHNVQDLIGGEVIVPRSKDLCVCVCAFVCVYVLGGGAAIATRRRSFAFS